MEVEASPVAMIPSSSFSPGLGIERVESSSSFRANRTTDSSRPARGSLVRRRAAAVSRVATTRFGRISNVAADRMIDSSTTIAAGVPEVSESAAACSTERRSWSRSPGSTTGIPRSAK